MKRKYLLLLSLLVASLANTLVAGVYVTGTANFCRTVGADTGKAWKVGSDMPLSLELGYGEFTFVLDMSKAVNNEELRFAISTSKGSSVSDWTSFNSTRYKATSSSDGNWWLYSGVTDLALTHGQNEGSFRIILSGEGVNNASTSVFSNTGYVVVKINTTDKKLTVSKADAYNVKYSTDNWADGVGITEAMTLQSDGTYTYTFTNPAEGLQLCLQKNGADFWANSSYLSYPGGVKEYTMDGTYGNNVTFAAGLVGDYKLTYNPSTNKLTIDGPEPTSTSIATPFFAFSTGGSWTFNQAMTATATAGVYTYDLDVAAGQTCYFAVQSAYVDSSDFTLFQFYTPVTTNDYDLKYQGLMPHVVAVSTDNNQKPFVISHGYYTVTIDGSDKDNVTVSIAERSGMPIRTPWIAYNNSGSTTWTFNQAMTAGDTDGMYSATITFGSTGYFAVQHAYNDGADYNNAQFYNPISEGNYLINSVPANDIAVSKTNSRTCFEVPAGTYTITVNGTNTDAVTVSVAGDIASTPIEMPYYAVNSGSGWQWNQPVTESETSGIYSFTVSGSGDGSGNIFFALQKGNSATGWDSAVFYSPSKTSGNNHVIATSSLPYNTTVADASSANKVCFQIPAGEYTVTVDGRDVNNITVTIDGDMAGEKIYFYGDMNMWTIAENNAGMTAEAKDLSGNDITSKVWPDGAPTRYTVAELDAQWRLHLIADAPEGYDTTDGPWYMIDFADKVDQNGHRGRLCGQFKLTDGNYSRDHWGSSFNDDKTENPDYYKTENGITPGTAFVATKRTGQRNLHMNCSYVDGAKLYLQPATNKVVITGTPVDIYVYYVGPDDAQTYSPAKSIVDLSQVNYFVDKSTFDAAAWEEVTDVPAPSGEVYSKAYRVKLPYGSEDRWPVEFNVTVAKSDGSDFPAVRVQCEDIWFIEKSIDVYFRYADGTEPTWVSYNTYYDTYDESGAVSGQVYSGGSADAYTTMDKVVVEGVTWYKSPATLPVNFATDAFALFRTSRGAFFPVDGIKAAGDDLAETRTMGTDLYYVVPDALTLENQLLYSHLKNTYQLGATPGDPLQINAEFYDPNNGSELDTSYDGVQYSFNISLNGSEIATKALSNEPFFDVPTLTEPGYYNIVAKAVKDGVTYTATDTYPVYDAAVRPAPAISLAATPDVPVYINTDRSSIDSSDGWSSGSYEMSYDGSVYYYTNTFTDSTYFLLSLTYYSGDPDWNTESGYISPDSSGDYWLGTGQLDKAITVYKDKRRAVKMSGITKDTYTIFYDPAASTITVKAGSYNPDPDPDPDPDPSGEYEVPAGDPADAYYLSSFTATAASPMGTKLSISLSSSASGLSWLKFTNALYDEDEATVAANTSAEHTCLNTTAAFYRTYAKSDDGSRVARTIEVTTVVTGVDDIAVDNPDVADSASETIYYTLQGVKVNSPRNGLYIRVCGRHADKVYIK
ncbi:MAG: hypothetical protein ACI30K_06790 [Muribaculaceae bacterium]